MALKNPADNNISGRGFSPDLPRAAIRYHDSNPLRGTYRAKLSTEDLMGHMVIRRTRAGYAANFPATIARPGGITSADLECEYTRICELCENWMHAKATGTVARSWADIPATTWSDAIRKWQLPAGLPEPVSAN